MYFQQAHDVAQNQQWHYGRLFSDDASYIGTYKYLKNTGVRVKILFKSIILKKYNSEVLLPR